jgi:photosystem II stability/assembly factor-like uncharacterized protein
MSPLKRTIRIATVALAVLFTAQACNLLFGDLYGNEGSGPRGMYQSFDSGDSWGMINKVAGEDGLAAVEVTEIFLERGNPDNIVITTRNAGVYASDTGGESWISLFPGVIAYGSFINPQRSDEIYVSGANPSRIATIWKSPDRGGVWQELFNEPTGQASVSALVFDPLDPSVFYGGLSNGTVIKSSDLGETWNALKNLGGRIVRMAVAVDNQRTVYALSETKGLTRSRDGGRSWTELKVFETGMFGSTRRTYNDLFIQPGSPDTIYVGASEGLFRSENGGDTWVRLELPSNQDSTNVSAVAVNSDNTAEIFAAVNWTVYHSRDRGATWRTVSLPTRRVISDIAVDPHQPNRVYAGVK